MLRTSQSQVNENVVEIVKIVAIRGVIQKFAARAPVCEIRDCQN